MKRINIRLNHAKKEKDGRGFFLKIVEALHSDISQLEHQLR